MMGNHGPLCLSCAEELAVLSRVGSFSAKQKSQGPTMLRRLYHCHISPLGRVSHRKQHILPVSQCVPGEHIVVLPHCYISRDVSAPPNFFLSGCLETQAINTFACLLTLHRFLNVGYGTVQSFCSRIFDLFKRSMLIFFWFYNSEEFFKANLKLYVFTSSLRTGYNGVSPKKLLPDRHGFDTHP